MSAPANANHPTEAWNALLNTAVLGLDRAGVVHVAAKAPWSYSSKDDSEDPVQQFLREVSTLAIYELAGRAATPAEGQATIEAFDPDERVCSPLAGRLLNEILHGDRTALLADWCAAASSAANTAPPELLPPLLELAVSNDSDSIRNDILAVIGHRGRWLAAQNPEWTPLLANSAADPADNTWETGALPERLVILRRLRSTDPAAARQLVVAVWDQESAADRTAMLEQLAVGLSTDDEPWLDERLDDRSKQVRAAAAALLSRLPTSAFAARMTERVGAAVRFVPGSGLIRKKPATLDVTLPEKPDEAMQRDCLEAKAQRGMGAKAALLNQIVAHAPLNSWLAVQGDVSKWINAALVSEWALPLVDGWKSAAVMQRDSQWASMLLTHVCLTTAKKDEAIDDNWRRAAIAPLVDALSPDTAQAFAIAVLANRSGDIPLWYLDDMLMACDFAWGEELSAAVVTFVKLRLQDPTPYDASLRQLISRAVRLRLAPSFADKVTALLPAQAEKWSDNLISLIHDLVDTVRFRSELRTAFSDQPHETTNRLMAITPGTGDPS